MNYRFLLATNNCALVWRIRLAEVVWGTDVMLMLVYIYSRLW